MNDPIKDFIEQNRAEFDHLEAPAFDIKRFKEKALITENSKPRTFKLPLIAKWLAAASVFIAVATFMLVNKDPKHIAVKDLVQIKSEAHTVKKPPGTTLDKLANVPLQNVQQESISNPQRNIFANSGRTIKQKTSLFDKLADSSSASTRLAALLEIKKQGTLSNYAVDRLANALNNDNNSNVRLAALDILGSYSNDKYVSSLLVYSLGTQSDPMVQLELVTLLGNMEHLKIEEKLYALAADPNTFTAVKDEAFSILLNQNKL